MTPISAFCLFGYAAAVGVILAATGNTGPDGWIAQVIGTAGAVPLGYWCAHCDEREGV